MQLPLIHPKLEKPLPWLLGLVAVSAVSATGIVYLSTDRSMTQAEAIASLTIPAEAATLTIRINASGVVQPIRRVNVSPKVQGRLAELYVEQGDRVEQGQPIARMERAELEAQLRQAQARLTRTQAELDKAIAGNRSEDIAEAQARLRRTQATLAELQAGSRSEDIAEAQASLNRAQALVAEAESRLDLAQERADRNQRLADEGAISRDELDQRLDDRRRAQAYLEQTQAGAIEAQRRLERLQNGSRVEDIAEAKATVAESQAALDRLINGTRPEDIAQAQAQLAEGKANLQYYQVQLEDTEVKAPFSGLIVQKYAEPGAFVTPVTAASSADSATSTSIVALAQGLEVLAKVPEADISQIYPNQKVEIIADAYPDRTFEGRVHLIAPEAIKERDVTLFQVRVEIETGLELLQSGMNVDLSFVGDELTNALVVPTVAIITNQGETGVLVPGDGDLPQFQPVTIGPLLGNQIQILEGIEPGQPVFVELPDGKTLNEIINREIK
ncbi:efflux RND transporter periplasmic adaptor subunit [Roseofilum reptotaenium CS-1145]|uniref:Efflux transporter periplasmic adaptor subunit n=1 Tax=Roseofilum reptotaenium AO1-A TaxID=1925591 RepID=A0A1L9QWX3_9CYAN|nr:efflux RND transporter periplasmic adaptor subunit [Roseofilum reptotaenium]MDB9519343.1 efflux RND transporter periplasmic adaptor subunit [Roseofilum reptotaenium CS-1145]OJJ27164.1 efflux transporter periplasmic adaptor subunit [Roseofilum reptotaenium AO1-A]